ncbi:MAG: DUF4097 family beta strand repeat-containing protein [Candidatus Gallimonas sp.]
MNKRKYLRRLRKALPDLSVKERENLIEYYAELIDDAYELGKSPREIFSELETPEEVAENYRRENRYSEPPIDDRRADEPRRPAPPSPSRDSGFSPLRLLLRLIGFVLGVGLVIAGGAACVAYFVALLTIYASGIFLIVMSFGVISAHLSVGLIQIGAGVACLGAGVLVNLLAAPLCRLYWRLTGWVIRGFRPSRMARKPLFGGKKIASCAAAVVLLAAGGLTGYFGFHGVGYDFRKIAVTDDFIQTTETVSLDGSELLSLNAPDLAIKVIPTEEPDVKFTYYASSERRLERSEDGSFTVTGAALSAKTFFSESWNRGVAYWGIVTQYCDATLEIPVAYNGNLNIVCRNGFIVLAGGEYGDVTLQTRNGYLRAEQVVCNKLTLTTHNGAVSVRDCTANTVEATSNNGLLEAIGLQSGTLTMQTGNGAIRLERVTADFTTTTATNGAVELDSLVSDHIRIETKNGAVEGTIRGNVADYKIDASSYGKNNLQNKSDGEKELYVRVKNGSVEIGFIE